MRFLHGSFLLVLKASLIFGALFLLTSCDALVSPRDVQINNQAMDLFAKEQPTEAHILWMNQLDALPLQPEVHFNLGLSNEVSNNVDFAQNYYLQALKLSKSNELKFYTLFNLGQLAAKQKDLNKALDFYQMALELKPDHYETKVNIELLIQQQQQQQQQEQQQQNQQQGQGQSQDQKQDTNQQQQKPDEKKDKSEEDNKEKDKDKSSDKDDEKDKSKNEESDKPEYEKNKKHQPRPFQGQELDQNDVNKILSELKQQEQKIRSNFNRKKVKEEPREKDW